MLEAAPRHLQARHPALAGLAGGALRLQLLQGGVQGGQDPAKDSQDQEHWGGEVEEWQIVRGEENLRMLISNDNQKLNRMGQCSSYRTL